MVDSLPPSAIDPDNITIMNNSNGELEVIESTQYYLANFGQDSGDWTGIDSVSDGIATVNVPTESKASASVTADLTDTDALTFRIKGGGLTSIVFEFDGIEEDWIDPTGDFVTAEIDGLDDYGSNTTVKIVGYSPQLSGTFWIDYVRYVIQPESRKFELVDTGGL